MGRDLLFSLALHVGIVALALLASPFATNGGLDDRVVIAIDVLFDGPPAVVEAAPEEPREPITVKPPKPVAEEPEEIPIGDPITNDEEVVIDDESEPEPPPPDKSVVQQSTDEVTTTNQPTVDDGPAEIHSTVTGKGAIFAGATVNNANFDYPYWFTQAFNKIVRNYRNPVASDGVIVCAVYFEVIKSGRVILKRIETSSGIDRFDEACLAAVDRAEPFPPLPRQFADEIIGITLPFRYDPSR